MLYVCMCVCKSIYMQMMVCVCMCVCVLDRQKIQSRDTIAVAMICTASLLGYTHLPETITSLILFLSLLVSVTLSLLLSYSLSL